jgi:hypothetical protein
MPHSSQASSADAAAIAAASTLNEKAACIESNSLFDERSLEENNKGRLRGASIKRPYTMLSAVRRAFIIKKSFDEYVDEGRSCVYS